MDLNNSSVKQIKTAENCLISFYISAILENEINQSLKIMTTLYTTHEQN